MEFTRYFDTEPGHQPDYLADIFNDVIDPDDIKEVAIQILENPASTEMQRKNALTFANAYKKYIDFEINTPPQSFGTKAVLVYPDGRILNQRAR